MPNQPDVPVGPTEFFLRNVTSMSQGKATHADLQVTYAAAQAYALCRIADHLGVLAEAVDRLQVELKPQEQ